MNTRFVRTSLGLIVSILVAGACEGETEDTDAIDECASDISVCGISLSQLTNFEDGTAYVPQYDELVAEWSDPSMGICRIAVRGTCEDGKVFLYMNGGFGSDAYYFDDGTFVGLAFTTDVGTCGRCPVAGFYGTPASVRCDNPQSEPLCDDQPWYGEPYLPFANGEAPQPCEDC